jgi:hypothetical protein
MEPFPKSKKSDTKRIQEEKRMKKEVPKPTKTATANHRKATMFEKVSSPAKDSFECDTVCPVGVQKRVSSSKLSRPEHGWFIPFVKYYEIRVFHSSIQGSES